VGDAPRGGLPEDVPEAGGGGGAVGGRGHLQPTAVAADALEGDHRGVGGRVLQPAPGTDRRAPEVLGVGGANLPWGGEARCERQLERR